MHDSLYARLVHGIAFRLQWNRKRARAALIKGIELVIIDNCNTTVSEMKPYAQMVGQRLHSASLVPLCLPPP